MSSMKSCHKNVNSGSLGVDTSFYLKMMCGLDILCILVMLKVWVLVVSLVLAFAFVFIFVLRVC